MSDIDTTPGGWPDKPGVPMHPERDGVHWLQITSPEDSVMIAATWEAGLWSYPSVDQDYAPEELARLGDAVRYIGPCHTPAEVAAQVEAARREEREAAAQKANSLTAGLTVTGRNYEAGYANGALDAARAIRAQGDA